MKRLLFLLFVTGATATMHAQNVDVMNFKNQANVFAPAPNAASLGKFGEIPVNEHTGIPSINVPIYLWNSIRSGIQLNVSLGYHAGGNKVEDIASSTGLGWSLNAGAMVTRTVKGLPDDNTWGYLNTDPLPNLNTTLYDGDYYHCPPSLSDEYTTMDTSRIAIIAPFNTAEQIEYTQLYAGSLDPEQDIFYYSVGDASGKFVLNKNGDVQKIDNSNFKISPLLAVSGGIKTIAGFKIITDRGIIYKLDQQEFSSNKTYTETSYHIPEGMTDFTPNLQGDAGSATTFYVSAIIDSLSKDTVYFEYTTHNIAYQSNFGESIEYHANDDPQYSLQGISTINRISSQTYSYNTNFTSQLALREIRLSDHSIINFFYEQARTDLAGDSALTKISISDYLGNKKQYKLRYSYFDASTYNSPDWTYTFTTTIDTYSPTADHFNKRLKLTGVDWMASDGTDSVRQYRFEYNSAILPPRNCKAIDFWGYFVGPYRSSYTLIPQLHTIDFMPSGEGLQTGYYYNWLNFYLEGADRRPDSIYCKAGVLEKMTYATGGYTKFEYEPNTVVGPIYPSSLKRSYKISHPIDSLSLRESIIFKNRSDTAVNIFANISRVNLDGTLYDPPYYDPNEVHACFEDAVSQHTITMTVKSTDNTVTKTADFTAIDSGYGRAWVVFYLPLDKEYTVSYKFNSGGDHCVDSAFFKIETVVNYPAEVDNDLVGGLRIKTVTNSAEVNGTFEKVGYNYNDSSGHSSGYIPVIPNNSEHVRCEAAWSTYDPSQFPVFLGYADYKSRNSGTAQTLGYSFGSNVGYARVEKAQFSDTKGLMGKTVSIFSTPVIRNRHDVFPYRSIQLIDWASGHLLREDTYNKSGNLQRKSIYTYSDVIDTFDTENNRSIKLALLRTDRSENPADPIQFRRYVAFAYYPINGYSRLISQQTIEFTGIDSLITSLNYEYDGFHNLTKIATLGSKGEHYRKVLHYPYEFNTTPTDALLAANNYNAPVLEDELLYNGSTRYQTGGNGVEYAVLSDSTVRPVRFYTYNTRIPINTSSVVFNTGSIPQSSYDKLDGEITKYDAYGNVLEFISKDSVRTSIIYGYKYTKPIAKITGAAYDDAISKFSTIGISSLQTISDPNILRSKLDEVRQGYVDSLVQVTTFTYKPMFGVESETNARGIITYYEYDGFGRLQLVRDKDSSITKRICYNYTGQPMNCTSILCGSSNCVGDNKKCINNFCETGVKVCTGNIREGSVWRHYFHYLWSDGTTSPTYLSDGVCEELEPGDLN